MFQNETLALKRNEIIRIHIPMWSELFVDCYDVTLEILKITSLKTASDSFSLTTGTFHEISYYLYYGYVFRFLVVSLLIAVTGSSFR